MKAYDAVIVYTSAGLLLMRLLFWDSIRWYCEVAATTRAGSSSCFYTILRKQVFSFHSEIRIHLLTRNYRSSGA